MERGIGRIDHERMTKALENANGIPVVISRRVGAVAALPATH
jgi:hypothetical protein